jgi:hypothetical protein
MQPETLDLAALPARRWRKTEEYSIRDVDVVKMGTILTKKVQVARQALGKRAANIVVVDTKRKPSASKR